MVTIYYSVFCIGLISHFVVVQGACCPTAVVIASDIPAPKCTISTIPIKTCSYSNSCPLPKPCQCSNCIKPCQCSNCINPCQCLNDIQYTCLNSCPITKLCQCPNSCTCNTCQCSNNVQCKCLNSCPISKPCQCHECITSPIVRCSSCIDLQSPIPFAIKEDSVANNLSDLLQIIVTGNLIGNNLPLNGLTVSPLTSCSKSICIL